jgi:hypothetical protein
VFYKLSEYFRSIDLLLYLNLVQYTNVKYSKVVRGKLIDSFDSWSFDSLKVIFESGSHVCWVFQLWQIYILNLVLNLVLWPRCTILGARKSMHGPWRARGAAARVREFRFYFIDYCKFPISSFLWSSDLCQRLGNRDFHIPFPWVRTTGLEEIVFVTFCHN